MMTNRTTSFGARNNKIIFISFDGKIGEEGSIKEDASSGMQVIRRDCTYCPHGSIIYCTSYIILK